VVVNCRQGAISEVWYFFNIAGSLQGGKFVPALPGQSVASYSLSAWACWKINIVTDGQHSRCPTTHIKYPPKRSSGEPTKTTTHGSEPTGAPFSGKGNLMVSTFNRQRGCIISYGTWYNAGTCATFQAVKTTGMT